MKSSHDLPELPKLNLSRLSDNDKDLLNALSYKNPLWEDDDYCDDYQKSRIRFERKEKSNNKKKNILIQSGKAQGGFNLGRKKVTCRLTPKSPKTRDGCGENTMRSTSTAASTEEVWRKKLEHDHQIQDQNSNDPGMWNQNKECPQTDRNDVCEEDLRNDKNIITIASIPHPQIDSNNRSSEGESPWWTSALSAALTTISSLGNERVERERVEMQQRIHQLELQQLEFRVASSHHFSYHHPSCHFSNHHPPDNFMTRILSLFQTSTESTQPLFRPVMHPTYSCPCHCQNLQRASWQTPLRILCLLGG